MIEVRMIGRAALAAALAMAAVPAAAEAVAGSEPTRAAAAERSETQKSERLICKRFNSTESRMKSFKACHTAEDWKKIERTD